MKPMYKVKPENWDKWGCNNDAEAIVDYAEIERLAGEWNMTVEGLMNQVDEWTVRGAIAELGKQHGYIMYRGLRYALTQTAYITNGKPDWEGKPTTHYEAMCIRTDASPNDRGIVPALKVYWDITNPDAEDESEACDWDDPSDMQMLGWYILPEKRMV